MTSLKRFREFSFVIWIPICYTFKVLDPMDWNQPEGQSVFEKISVELLEKSFDELPEGPYKYVPYQGNLEYMVVFGHTSYFGITNHIRDHCEGWFVTDHLVITTKTCCETMKAREGYIFYGTDAMSSKIILKIFDLGSINRAYRIWVENPTENIIDSSAKTDSQGSEVCFMPFDEEINSYSGAYPKPWNRMRDGYEDLDECDVFTWKHYGGDGIFRFHGRYLGQKLCKERQPGLELTKYQFCMLLFSEDIPCDLYQGGPVYCSNGETNSLVGIMTNPQNEDEYTCKNSERMIIFERIDLIEKFYCETTKTCSITKGDKETKTVQVDTTPPDPYGEGSYAPGTSGEYKIPGETYIQDDGFEEEGDGLPIDEGDLPEDETNSEEGGLQAYGGADPDDTDVVAPDSDEYGLSEGSKHNLTQMDDPNYPGGPSPDGSPFYNPENELNDSHYLSPEALADGVPKDYYDVTQVTANLKPWIGFPDDGAASEDSKDYGDSPPSGSYSTVAEENIYFYAGQNYDNTTPVIPYPDDVNVNTIEVQTLAQAVTLDGQVLQGYPVVGYSQGLGEVVPGYPYDKRYPSTPPVLPPERVGKKPKDGEGRPEVLADAFWNDGLNIFQPAYGRGVTKVKPVEMNEVYDSMLQPYDLAALGPEPKIGRRVNSPSKKTTKVLKGRRVMKKTGRKQIGDEDRHGLFVGAYGEGGPQHPIADTGVEGFSALSAQRDSERGKYVAIGPLGGLLPSFTGQKIQKNFKPVAVFAEGIVTQPSPKFPAARPKDWQPWDNNAEFDETYESKNEEFKPETFVMEYPNAEFNFKPDSEEKVPVEYQSNCVYITVMIVHGILFVCIVITCAGIVGVKVHKYKEKKLIAETMAAQEAEEEARKENEKAEAEELLRKQNRAQLKAAYLERKAVRDAELARMAEEGSPPKEKQS